MSGIATPYCVYLTVQEMSNCFPEWLYHFTYPLAMSEISSRSTSLSALGIVSILKIYPL